MNKALIALTTSLSLLFAASPAGAVEFRAVGTLNLSNVSLSAGVQDGVQKFGFGALAMQNLGLWDLQTGLLFTPIGAGSAGTDLWTNYLQIPAVMKISLPLVSAGFGAYYGIPLSGGTNLTGVSALKGRSDLGLMAVAGIKYPLNESWYIVSDAAYQFGFKDISDPASTVTAKTRNLMILVGLAYQVF